MKKMTKAMLMTALILGSVSMGTAVEASELHEFTLDPMIVTAQGFETKDLDTPASVEVFDEKDIEESGANNAFDVLTNTLGVTMQSQGFNGTAMSTMTSKIMIRGVDTGTLVLVNGVPMNIDGKYNLEDIPSDAIEKIEVVKGGGAILYGSDATGGVVNIITKKTVKNKIKVQAGNFGKERYDISVGAGKFDLIAGLENRGKAEDMSTVGYGKDPKTENVYDYGKGERKSIRWNYKINDGLTFTHNYSENEHRYLRKKYSTGKYNQINDYENTENTFTLNYDKDDWKAYVSYGTQERNYDKTTGSVGAWGARQLSSWREGHNTNVNIQKLLTTGNNKLLVGVNYQNEELDLHAAKSSSAPETKSNLERSNYSIYMSYDMALNDKSNLILNMRETWAQNCEGTQLQVENGKTTTTKNDDLSKFTPEAEYIYRINEDSSFYAKAGKSFRLPNLTQIYGTGLINSTLNLKPEQGTHYEMGYKLNEGNKAWRLAVFNYKIKDSIEADTTRNELGEITEVNYINQDVKNTGIELSCSIAHDDNWNSSWGVTYHNPKARNESAKNGYGDDKWHDYLGKYQINGSINYNSDKFTGSLKGNFVGDRTSNEKTQHDKKPQFFTDLHLSYQPEQNHKVFLHINNLLDRQDITTNGTSNYLTLGRNFMLGYEYSF